MRALLPHEIIGVWESGQNQHPVDRALTMLEPIFSPTTRHELARFTIGERDTHLLTLREHTFGDVLKGFAACPSCHEKLEFSIKVADIRMEAPPAKDVPLELTNDEYVVQFRIPNSLDLAAVADSPNVTVARLALLKRCIVGATHARKAISDDNVFESLASSIAGEILQRDPQAELELSLCCPACDTNWQLNLDIASFLWTEIDDQAKRLLEEVHVLASAYGWSEADILSMSSARRKYYLEMVA